MPKKQRRQGVRACKECDVQRRLCAAIARVDGRPVGEQQLRLREGTRLFRRSLSARVPRLRTNRMEERLVAGRAGLSGRRAVLEQQSGARLVAKSKREL